MEEEIFGHSQNTLLAGGRYDYLASQFGFIKGE
jgi:histidyl-tRNA synthetase